MLRREVSLLALSGHQPVRCTCLLLGVKRTILFALHMSANDPKRTLSALRQLEAALLSTRSRVLRAHLAKPPARWPLRCNNVVLETSRPLLHIWSVARVRPTPAQAGGHSRPLTRPFRNGEFDVASSSSSIRRYAEGAPQRGLHRAHERRRCRRVDGASQAGLVALCAAPRN